MIIRSSSGTARWAGARGPGEFGSPEANAARSRGIRPAVALTVRLGVGPGP